MIYLCTVVFIVLTTALVMFDGWLFTDSERWVYYDSWKNMIMHLIAVFVGVSSFVSAVIAIVCLYKTMAALLTLVCAVT